MTKIEDLRYKVIFGEMKLESEVIKQGKKETRKIRNNIKKCFDKLY